MPKFSVIIPIYNTGEFLRECLDSAVNQTFGDIEIIGVDDGSTDDSGKILDEYAANDNRVIAIHQENQGMSCARNRGMAIAKGEYITFLDSDDYWREDTLQILHNRLKKDDLDMLFLGGINFDNVSKKLQKVPAYQFECIPPDFDNKCFSYEDCENCTMELSVCPWSACYKHEFLKGNKIIFPPHLFFEDNLFFVKAFFRAKRCGICRDILYFRRVHPASVTQNWNKHFDDYLTIYQKVMEFIDALPVSNVIKNIYQDLGIRRPTTIYNRFKTADQEKYKVHFKSFMEYNEMKKKKPTLSIITICYNIKDEIERTCKSIVNQTWQDFEWIVVDGGSTDGTIEVLKKYQDRMTVFISEKDKGLYNAMNKGIVHAQGEWLNFMNGGDEYAVTDALERVFKDKQYERNILQGEEERFNPDGTFFHVWHYKKPITKYTFLKYSMAHQSAFYRRSLFEKYGLYDESYKYCADTEMNIRLTAAGEQVELLDFIVGRFWLNGVTMKPENKEPRRLEHERFNSIYYTREEMLQHPSKYLTDAIIIKQYRLFGFLPLLTIEEE